MTGTPAQLGRYVCRDLTVPPSHRAWVDDAAPDLGAAGTTGNLWDLTERLHVDLERTASSACRP